MLTCSIGVAVSREHGDRPETLIEAADGAMYQAKQSGRNQVCVVGEEMSLVSAMLAETDDPQTAGSEALQSLVTGAYAYDKETNIHAQRMAKLVYATARELGCAEDERHLLCLVAMLHDIDKIGIPQLSVARAELQRCAGSQFDPAVVSAFMRVLDMQEHLDTAALAQAV